MEPAVEQLELTGVITSQTIPQLIQMISQTGETGVFVVADQDSEKKVFFDKGRAVFAVSSDPDDRLGALFLRKGLLTIETLAKAGEISFRTGKRLGTNDVPSDLESLRDGADFRWVSHVHSLSGHGAL